MFMRRAARPRVGNLAIMGMILLLIMAPLAPAKGISRGAKVSIVLRTGGGVAGRLIGVRSDAVVLDVAPGGESTVLVADISTLRVHRKSAVFPGILFGAAGGTAIGYGLSYPRYKDKLLGEIAIFGAAGLGLALGGVVGGVVGGAAVGDKTYDFASMSDEEKGRVLEKLRKRAEAPGYR